MVSGTISTESSSFISRVKACSSLSPSSLFPPGVNQVSFPLLLVNKVFLSLRRINPNLSMKVLFINFILAYPWLPPPKSQGQNLPTQNPPAPSRTLQIYQNYLFQMS